MNLINLQILLFGPAHRWAQAGSRPEGCLRRPASWPAQAGVQAGDQPEGSGLLAGPGRDHGREHGDDTGVWRRRSAPARGRGGAGEGLGKSGAHPGRVRRLGSDGDDYDGRMLPGTSAASSGTRRRRRARLARPRASPQTPGSCKGRGRRGGEDDAPRFVRGGAYRRRCVDELELELGRGAVTHGR